MTPAARVQAAIEILDRIEDGVPAEQALTNWTRSSRFAGSKDRAAIRDHVFDVLRRWRSTAVQGGAETGRARMTGLLRQHGVVLETIFSGVGHAPAPLTVEELATGEEPEGAAGLDIPDWLVPAWEASLMQKSGDIAEVLRDRADIYLRVNLIKTDVETIRTLLLSDGIETEPHPLSDTALRVVTNPRRISQTQAYQTGLVELQDVASQAVVDAIPLGAADRILDYCAGGGGKALAMAARAKGAVIDVHDKNPKRMKDLPERAKRAGARVRTVAAPQPGYDVVLCDVPCSGSGAWRRSPEGKWRLTSDLLDETLAIQTDILSTCAALVASGGYLVYATCSLLKQENHDQILLFLTENVDFTCVTQQQFDPLDGGDGFFASVLARKKEA